MNQMTFRPRLSRIALPLVVSLALAACGGPRAKTGDLAELETLRAREYSAEIRKPFADEPEPNLKRLRQSANELVKLSDAYYELSLESFDERDPANTDARAKIALMYYRAAENYARSADARVRLNQANQRYQEQLSRRNDYQKRLQGEQELVTLLETIQTLFKRNEELRRSLDSFEERAKSESRSIYALQEARIKKTEAEGLKAPDFAGAKFGEAQNLLARAETFYNDEKFDDAYQTALQAQEAFKNASDVSRAQWTEEQDKLLRNTESQAIYERAQKEFGVRNAFIDARGIVVVTSGIFDGRSSGLSNGGRTLLDKVVEIAKQYKNHSIVIEGHTDDRGDDASNQSLSQARANAVQDYFLQRALATARLSVQAFGESKPRFQGQQAAERDKNNRVEIIFRGK
jgi:outer membrane protein OmpA-like peptidoglycan-associated protein